MPSLTRCHRHATNVWMAYCPDCTAWHLALQMARRNAYLAALPRCVGTEAQMLDHSLECSVPSECTGHAQSCALL